MTITGALRSIWARWRAIAHVIGDFQARILLSAAYFVLIAPFALGVRMFSDPLRLRAGTTPAWSERPTAREEPVAAFRRQF
jgi:hypothetical protein